MDMMLVLKSKWFLFVGISIILLVILALTGRKSVHAEIIINSTPQKVWEVLMDKGAYKDWNTVLIPVKGELVEGEKVEYQFCQDENTKTTIPSKVKRIEEGKLLNQAGGMLGVLTYNHKYILEKVKEGTKVIIHEDYRGIGVNFWNPAPVQKAYERLCEDLKARCVLLSKD
jgi:hypothetical protein